MNASTDLEENLVTARQLINQACNEESPDLVVLPECFAFYGGTQESQRAAAQACPGGTAYAMLQSAAMENNVFICGGSINELCNEAVYNTSFVFDPNGIEVAKYRKIHMFAITTPDGQEYDEGKLYNPGDSLATFDVNGVTVGCAICYDLRFPEMFQDLADRGAQVILLPSAFTLHTGKEHWEPLIRARAIDTQCFVLAPAMEGAYEEDGKMLATYGHTMAVAPWGAVIAQRAIGNGYITARLDLAEVESARQRVPLSRHRKSRHAWA